MAIAALVCGIAGWLCVIPAILAVIFGFVAKGQIRDSQGTQSGEGMATAGIVLGFVWIALTILLLATGAIDVDSTSN
jgi:predicted acyltransferase